MSEQETIADIVAEMRALSNPISDSIIAINGRSIADRLEAARKREKATAEKSSTVGDAAKLREALLRCDAIAQLPEVRNEQSIKDMRNIIRHALAAPPRNCDVGTVGEQEDRFFNFCKNHDCTVNCLVKKKWDFAWGHNPSCGVLFSQMPYEEGGAK